MQLHIGANAWQGAFIAMIIFAGPLLAIALLWTRLRRTGLILLSSSMAGSLMFGLTYHFLATGADNALEMNRGNWQNVFGTTALLLAAIELVGTAWPVRVLLFESSDASKTR